MGIRPRHVVCRCLPSSSGSALSPLCAPPCHLSMWRGPWLTCVSLPSPDLGKCRPGRPSTPPQLCGPGTTLNVMGFTVLVCEGGWQLPQQLSSLRVTSPMSLPIRYLWREGRGAGALLAPSALRTACRRRLRGGAVSLLGTQAPQTCPDPVAARQSREAWPGSASWEPCRPPWSRIVVMSTLGWPVLVTCARGHRCPRNA